MDKSDNYGGVPKDVFDDIADACVNTPLPGLTPELRITLLNALLLEEHATIKGGPGQTGIPDAMALFDELRKRMKALRTAPLAGVPAAAAQVVTQLNTIGTQWGKVGTVHRAFYTLT